MECGSSCPLQDFVSDDTRPCYVYGLWSLCLYFASWKNDIGSVGLYRSLDLFIKLSLVGVSERTQPISFIIICMLYDVARESTPKFHHSPLHAFICPSSPAVNTVLCYGYISDAVLEIYDRIRTESRKQKDLTISDP